MREGFNGSVLAQAHLERAQEPIAQRLGLRVEALQLACAPFFQRLVLERLELDIVQSARAFFK